MMILDISTVESSAGSQLTVMALASLFLNMIDDMEEVIKKLQVATDCAFEVIVTDNIAEEISEMLKN